MGIRERDRLLALTGEGLPAEGASGGPTLAPPLGQNLVLHCSPGSWDEPEALQVPRRSHCRNVTLTVGLEEVSERIWVGSTGGKSRAPC